MSRKRLIILSAVGVLVIAGGVVAAMLLFKNTIEGPVAFSTDSRDGDPSLQEERTVPDLSIDLGACQTVTVDQIQTSLSDLAATPGEPVNRGYGHEANGDISQSCVYPLNSTNSQQNRLTITITQFNSDEHKNIARTSFSGLDVISDVGQSAYYFAVPADMKSQPQQYLLYVFNGNRLYSFDLLQKTDKPAASSSSALTSLVKAAQYQ